MIPSLPQSKQILLKSIALLSILISCLSFSYAQAQESNGSEYELETEPTEIPEPVVEEGDENTETEEAEEPLPENAEYKSLHTRFYGGVIFGSPLSEAEESLGEKLQTDGEVDESCSVGTFARYPGVYFMVQDGIIVRGSTDESKISTHTGLSVGSSIDDVLAQYPDATIENHNYSDGAHYITFTGPDGKYAYRFEEENGSVTNMSAGLLDAVQLVEGCL